MNNKIKLLAGLVSLSINTSLIAANEFEIPRIQQKSSIDGELSESHWNNALMVTLDYETRPAENTKPSVGTKVYLYEDGKTLYVAFEAFDTNPEDIRAYFRDRDKAYSDDFVGIILDTYNDETRAFEFFSNALGAQMDMLNNEAGHGEDDSWDAIWDSAGQITENGYVVEMAIPLSALSFAEQDMQTWGIDIVRFRPRSKRERIALNKLDRNINCYLCQASKIKGFRDLKQGTNLVVVPSLTANKTESKDADYDTGTYSDWESDGSEQELSLDMKWGITQNSTLNLTVNPDFSQIEADSTQLTVNNQYALFFQEKRPFFLEAKDYFSSPIDTIYTRSIAAPDFGVKYTSKIDNATIGVIAGTDSVTNLIMPNDTYQGSYLTNLSEEMGSDSPIESDFFISRYRYDLGNSSNVGALVTHRQGEGYHNTVAGIDSKYRFNDSDSITVQYLRSDTQYSDDTNSFSDDSFRLSYNRGTRDYFIYSNYMATGQDFRADLGFINQYSFNKFVAGGGYIWHGKQGATFDRFDISGDWDITHDDDGQLLEKEIEAYFSISGPLQSRIRLGGGKRDNLNRQLITQEDNNGNIIDEYVEAKLYDEKFYSFNANINPFNGFAIDFWGNFGDRIDYANDRLGDYTQLGVWLGYNITRNLELSTRLIDASLHHNLGGKIFNQSISDIKLNYQFNMQSGLRLTVQNSKVTRNLDLYDNPDDYQSESKYSALQLLYSYKLNPQTVIFAGYSDAGFADDTFAELKKSTRSVFLKFSYAWQP